MLTVNEKRDTEAILIQVPTKILAELDLIAPNQEPFNGPLRIQEYIGKVVTEIFEKEMGGDRGVNPPTRKNKISISNGGNYGK